MFAEERGIKAHVAQREVRSTGNDEARVFPNRKIVLVAIAGIGGHEIQRDVRAVCRSGNLQPHFPRADERGNRHLPGLGAVPLADVADLREAPQGLLPLGNRLHQVASVARFGRAPESAHRVEQERRFRFIQRLPQRAQILGVESVQACHVRDRFLLRLEGAAFRERGCEIFLQRQDAPVLGVELDALQVHGGTAALLRELRVESPDCHHLFLRPIPLRRAGRERDSVGQQHRVGRDVLRGIEILRHERRRHHKGVADVHEAFAGSGVGRKLLRRVERPHAGQIADGVGIFGVGETAEHDRAGVAGAGLSGGGQRCLDPLEQVLSFAGRRLRLVLGRHFPERHLINHVLPCFRMFEQLGERGEAFEVEVALLLLGRMAAEAILLQHRPGPSCEISFQGPGPWDRGGASNRNERA